MSEAPRVEIVVCERHGLRYNAAEGQGCVRCRREAGAAAPRPGAPASRPASSAAAASSPVERPVSTGVQLLIAVAVIGGTGAMFWAAHQQVMSSVDSIFGVASQASGGATALDTGLEGEPAGDDVAPAEYPPGDTVAVGPAAQEQQMRELMRQMQDDARADAADAAEAAREADPGADQGADPFDPGQ